MWRRNHRRACCPGRRATWHPSRPEDRDIGLTGGTDIYALGVILYRMLTGRMPFQSKMVAELLRQVVEDEAQPPRQLVRDLPEEVETICMKAMSKRFKSRYSNADDFARALRGVLSSSRAAQHRRTGRVRGSLIRRWTCTPRWKQTRCTTPTSCGNRRCTGSRRKIDPATDIDDPTARTSLDP